jgi:hypothetical protein
MDELLARVLDAHGGLDRWSGITRLTAQMSIGGPIWAAKGWPGALVHETVEMHAHREHSEFTPFTKPDRRLAFDGNPEKVTVLGARGQVIEQRDDPRAAFNTHLRTTPWDAMHLGYFIGYAFWNYLTTPFVFTYPAVQAREIKPWHEAGQTWRRLAVTFPDTIATHNPEQVYYYDPDGMQRRMDYVTEVLGSSLVAHYTSQHRDFDGFMFPTRRRVFRRNFDGTANVNAPSITIDIHKIIVK